jgi:hypothetical protein
MTVVVGSAEDTGAAEDVVVALTVAGQMVVVDSMVWVTMISCWYEAGQLTTLAAQLVMVYVVYVVYVDVVTSSSVALVDEFVTGNG